MSTSETILTLAEIPTPLGAVVALADETRLYQLSFADHAELPKYTIKTTKGKNAITNQIAFELENYFAHRNFTFTTPVHLSGTDFQKNVWNNLLKIPAGETRSYLDIAKALNKPKSFRAVANANGANKFVIMIPCHRVIYANGTLGGYSSGLERKKWLLAHENTLL